MKVTCNKCGVEMEHREVETSYKCFIDFYICPKCGRSVTVDWKSEGYEMIEEYPWDD